MSRLNFQFRYQPRKSTRYAPLINYFNSAKGELEMPRKEMILTALEAFWMPFAVAWSGGSEEEIKRVVTRSLFLLEHQMRFLGDRFSITVEGTPYASAVPDIPQTKTTEEKKGNPGSDFDEEEEWEEERDPADYDFSEEDQFLQSF